MVKIRQLWGTEAGNFYNQPIRQCPESNGEPPYEYNTVDAN